jgi:hypothetical protein
LDDQKIIIPLLAGAVETSFRNKAKTSLRSNHSPIRGKPGTLYPKVNQPEHETENLPAIQSKIKMIEAIINAPRTPSWCAH